MSGFVSGISHVYIPKGPAGGRLTRVTFDIDMDAVHEYVYHERSPAREPWSLKVADELIEKLTELAQNDEMVALITARKS